MEQFSEARIADPDLIDLVQKVKVHRSAELNKGYPAGIPNLVEVKLRSGTIVGKQVDFPRGHDRNPMTDREVEQKFEALCEPLFPKQQVRAILDALWDLEEMEDVGRIVSMFEV